MRWITRLYFEPSPTIQYSRQVVVRHVRIDVALLHRLQILFREKSAIRAYLLGPFPAFSFYGLDHGTNRPLSVTSWLICCATIK